MMHMNWPGGRVLKAAAALTALALLFAARGLAQRKTDPALNALARDFAAAFNIKDAARIAAFYADDAVVMAPEQTMVQGRRNIQAYYVKGFEQDVSDLRLVPMESKTAGDHAFETGTSRLTYRAGSSLLSGPGPKAETGKYVVIYKRIAGEWKIAYDIFNTD